MDSIILKLLTDIESNVKELQSQQKKQSDINDSIIFATKTLQDDVKTLKNELHQEGFCNAPFYCHCICLSHISQQ